MIQAVLFDMDGTLIDTEKYYRIFWPKALEAYGYTMTDEQALTMRSLGRPFAPRQLKDWYGEDFAVSTMLLCLQRQDLKDLTFATVRTTR